MFKNISHDGTRNICGKNVFYLRKQKGISQRKLSDQLLLLGLDINKNAIQKIESGERFVTDIELKIIAQYFNVAADELLKNDLTGCKGKSC